MTLADLQKYLRPEQKLTVHFLGASGKFIAAITNNGRRVHAATAENLEDAIVLALANAVAPVGPTGPR